MNDYFAKIGFWSKGSGVMSYIGGFVLSLVLTLTAYSLVVHQTFSYIPLLIILIVLALLQFAVQAICFLHLGEHGAAHERLVIFATASIVVVIIVSGSLWIMFSLSNRMTAPSTSQMEDYMQNQSGF